MKTVIKLTIVGFWLSLSMACSQQEAVFETIVDTRSLPIEMSMSPLTRNSSEVINDLAKMGVFRTSVGGYKSLNNVRYTFHASGANVGRWVSDDVGDTTRTIYMDHRVGALFAFYPYQENLINGTLLTMNGLKRYDEQSNSCLSDLTRASNDIIAGFTVKPIYSRLSLLVKNNDPTKSCIIKNVKITSLVENFKTSATLEMNTENPVVNLTNSQTAGFYTFPLVATDSISVKGISPLQANATIDILWIPQLLNGMRIEITFHWSGQTNNRIVQMVVPKEKLVELKRATHHQFQLTIKAF